MNRGLTINALFSGESGTGKTMAAEVIANALKLDLYRIDWFSVVSKFIRGQRRCCEYKFAFERLVLDGVDLQPQQKNSLKEAVASVLRQQLNDQGAGATMLSATSSSSVSGGSISIKNSQGAESLGQQIGHAVYRGTGK